MILLPTDSLHKESPRSMEYHVPLESRNPLELRRNRIEYPSIKRCSLCDILRIQCLEFRDILVGSAGYKVGFNVFRKLVAGGHVETGEREQCAFVIAVPAYKGYIGNFTVLNELLRVVGEEGTVCSWKPSKSKRLIVHL